MCTYSRIIVLSFACFFFSSIGHVRLLEKIATPGAKVYGYLFFKDSHGGYMTVDVPYICSHVLDRLVAGKVSL